MRQLEQSAILADADRKLNFKLQFRLGFKSRVRARGEPDPPRPKLRAELLPRLPPKLRAAFAARFPPEFLRAGLAPRFPPKERAELVPRLPPKLALPRGRAAGCDRVTALRGLGVARTRGAGLADARGVTLVLRGWRTAVPVRRGDPLGATLRCEKLLEPSVDGERGCGEAVAGGDRRDESTTRRCGRLT